MRALLIRVNYRTGTRAGGVDPKDNNLQSYGWQSLPREPGEDVEIRIVEDDRDLDRFEDEPGVKVLEGAEAIDTAIDEYIPPKYQIGDREDVREWARREDVDLNEFPDANPDRARELYEAGADTVTKKEPPKVSDVMDNFEGGL